MFIKFLLSHLKYVAVVLRIIKSKLVFKNATGPTVALCAKSTSPFFAIPFFNNLALYSDKNLHGPDPEFFNAGGVALPINKQFTLSLKVGF